MTPEQIQKGNAAIAKWLGRTDSLDYSADPVAFVELLKGLADREFEPSVEYGCWDIENNTMWFAGINTIHASGSTPQLALFNYTLELSEVAALMEPTTSDKSTS